MEELNIDYNKIDEKIVRSIMAIEAKPHVRYIRYLLVKRYSPTSIKKELFRLGLSAPHEPNLASYYLCVIDPIIKQFGLSDFYADYKNKLLRKNSRCDFVKSILNFKLDLKDNLDGQVKFLKMIKSIGIDSIWLKELYNFYGSADRFPLDENGNKILDVSTPNKNAEKILIQPKRFLIDTMILQNVPDRRIAEYCREKFKIPVNDYDIRAYKAIFFNIKSQNIEDKINSLDVEKNSLEALLSDLTNGSFDLEIGEKMNITKQTEQRISELSDNIQTLNSLFSDIAFQQATSSTEDAEKMFLDVVSRAYMRFTKLDRNADRDVVDPLFKVARMMVFAHDKVETIRNTSNNKLNPDTHSQNELLELYKKRVDEVFDEENARANKELTKLGNDVIDPYIDPNDILGAEELNISFDAPIEE